MKVLRTLLLATVALAAGRGVVAQSTAGGAPMGMSGGAPMGMSGSAPMGMSGTMQPPGGSTGANDGPQPCSSDNSLPPCGPTPDGTATQCMIYSTLSPTGVCIPPGAPGSICNTAADCLVLPFFGAQSCNPVGPTVPTKMCLPDILNGLTGGSAPPPGLCATMADCGGIRNCVGGFCVAFDPPTANCMVNGASTCLTGQDCFMGVCVPHRDTVQCNPACNAAAGEKCNEYFGRCEAGQQPPQCDVTCDLMTNRCLPPVYPGLPPVCQPIGSTCTSSDTCMLANPDTKCMLGYCTPCNALCSLSSDLLSSLFQAGGGISQFNAPQPPELVSVTMEGRVAAIAGQILQLNASIPVRSMTFDAANPAAAQIMNGQKLILDALSATTAGGQMLLTAGAQFLSNMLDIGANGGMTFSLGSGTQTDRTIANFSALTLNGPLQVSGDMTTRLVFPSMASMVSTPGANGIVRVSGGLSLVGNLGAVPLQISGTDNEQRDARVLGEDTLVVAGPILGAKGRLIVSGRMEISGSSVEPRLQLVDSARVSIQARTAGVNCGNLTFSGLGAGQLEVNTTATAGGASVVFGLIENCPSSATIKVNVQGTAAAALASGVTLLSYGVDTFANVGAFTCGIQVCGSDGVCKTITNPNAPTHARRLLTASTSTAAWEPTKLSASSTTPSGASASASVASGVLAALAAFAMITMRM